jgi:hypothetical protein
MVVSSAQMSQMFMAQNAMFSGQAAYAQQLNYPLQAATRPGMPPPPPAPPPMSIPSMLSSGAGGIYGEQLAARVGGAGQSAANIGMGMFNPLSLGMTGMMLGGPMGAAAGVTAGVPMYAAGQVVGAYGGNFMRGMQEQAGLNSTLRANFGFFGGQGFMGRGFNQGQMGQIGQSVGDEVRNNVYTTAGELNQLIAGGAQAGMFTGARDVTEFTQKFRQMLNTLKDVQRELGGTLSEALSFIQQSKQSGIFQKIDRVAFSAELRGAESASGLSRNQLLDLSQQGAALARQVGGYGRQGATGALRAASGLGAAVQSGAINEEALSEMTGGLTGGEALQAAVGQIMGHTARFSRRAMGRFSIFSMSNERGTGLDEGMLERFRAGDLSVGDVRRGAHQNVARMGRARAMNQEGTLRGALLEEGGLAGQIGMMRLMVGDRVLDQSDALASQVIQRRMGVSRPQAEMMMSLMRNQGMIAEQETMDRSAGRRQQHLQTDIQENRSIDSFMRHLSHGVQEGTGVMRAREMGRSVMTRVSSLVERATNDILGIAENQVTQSDRQSLNRTVMGRGSLEDFQRLVRGGGGVDLFQQGALSELRGAASPGEILGRRGVNVRGLSGTEQLMEARNMFSARRGVLTRESERAELAELERDVGGTSLQLSRARMLSRGSGGGTDGIYRFMGGVSAAAVDAFQHRQGAAMTGAAFGEGVLLDRPQGSLSAGMVWDDIRNTALRNTGGSTWSTPMGVPLRMAGHLVGTAGRAALRFAEGADVGSVGDELGLRSLQALGNDRERAAGRLARGGELAESLQRRGAQGEYSLLERAGAFLGFEGREITTNDAMLTALRGVRQEDFEAILGNEDIQGDLRGVLGAGSDAERRARLGVLGTRALGLEGGQRNAADSLIEQLRRGGGGKVSQTLRRDLELAMGGNRERDRQRLIEQQQIGADFLGLGARLGDAGFGGKGSMATDMLNLGRGYTTGGGSFSPEAMQNARERLIQQAADMDPSSEAYGRYVEAMGGDEAGRREIQLASGRRQHVRELTGGGRRGRRGQAEALFGGLTGNTLSEMELSVGTRGGGRRELRGNNVAGQLMQIFQHGTEAQREDMITQISGQMRGQGVRGAEDLVRTVANATSDGRVTRQEGHEISRMMSSNKDIQRIQRRALERRQRAENVLDAARNDLLRTMNDNIAAMARRNGEPGVPPPEGNGG